MKRYIVLLAVATMALGASGCAKPWQTARTIVNAAAGSVAAADTILVAAYEASSCEGQEDPTELEACIERGEQQIEALRIAGAAVTEGESLVDIWERAETEPEDWGGWLTATGQALARLVALIEAAGVEVPGELTRWASLLDDYLEGR